MTYLRVRCIPSPIFVGLPWHLGTPWFTAHKEIGNEAVPACCQDCPSTSDRYQQQPPDHDSVPVAVKVLSVLDS